MVPVEAENTKEIARSRKAVGILWMGKSKFNETEENGGQTTGQHDKAVPEALRNLHVYYAPVFFSLLSSCNKHRVVENNLHCFQAQPRVCLRAGRQFRRRFRSSCQGTFLLYSPCPLITR